MLEPYKQDVKTRLKKWNRLLEVIVDWWPSILFGLLTVCSIGISAFPNWRIIVGDSIQFPGRYLLAGMAFLLLIFGGLGSIKNKRTLSNMDREIRALKNLIDTYQVDTLEVSKFALTKLAYDCGLIEKTQLKRDLRLTVYCHDEKHSRFIPASRIAGSPVYEMFGRPWYPDHLGVIGEGWLKGYAMENSSTTSDEDWITEAVDKGFNREVAANISMKSKSLVAVRIEHSGKFVGIAVAESLNKSGCRQVGPQMKKSDWLPQLAELLVLVKSSLIAHSLTEVHNPAANNFD